jgi:uncharacterized repeat protein (TIGR01451 family)
MKSRRGLAGPGRTRRSAASNPILERVEDRLLLTTFDVSNTADSGAGSLRQAILDSNGSTTALPNIIDFSMLGAATGGVYQFKPASPLPTITEPVSIAGTTAPAYNSAAPAPVIEILGNNPNLSSGSPALTVNSANVQISALSIVDFFNAGIALDSGSDTVTGSYIGVAPDGVTPALNDADGIDIASPGNTIGGTTAATRNVISSNNYAINISTGDNNLIEGNYIGTDATGKVTKNLGYFFAGIQVQSSANTIGGVNSGVGGSIGGAGNLITGGLVGIQINGGTTANNNLIEGNYVGTDVTGQKALQGTFSGDGILVSGNSAGTTIGGTTSGVANVISANGANGVELQGSNVQRSQVLGNFIGVTAPINGSTAPLGNAQSGVYVNGANVVDIGYAFTDPTGDPRAYGNVIAYNGTGATQAPGIKLTGASNVAILSNSIFNNGQGGIQNNFSNSGVQPPTLTSVQSGAAQSRISGTYSGSPNTSYRIQFFSSPALDGNGFAEGKVYLGSIDIRTNAVGAATINTVLQTGVAVGQPVTATATFQFPQVNNTSIFSSPVSATQAAVTDLAVSTSVPPGNALLGQDYVYTITVKNNGPNAATGVVLLDTLPTFAQYVSSSAGVYNKNANTLSDQIGDLASGASQVVVLTVRPTSTSSSLVNVASVSGNELDENLSNNSFTTTTPVLADADLAAVLNNTATVPSGGGTPITPIGSPITYTLSVYNFGPSTAPSVQTIVTLPTSFTSIVVQPDQGTYTIAGNVITIKSGIIPASSNSQIQITATPTSIGATTVTAVTSSLPVGNETSGIFDPNLANNTATSPVTVVNSADLGVSINSIPDPVLVGQLLTYSVQVSNNGPSAATTPIFSQVLPTGVTYNAAGSSSSDGATLTYDSTTNTVSANLAAIQAGDITTITIAVIPSTAGQITTTASITDPSEIDPDTTNNSATNTTQVSPADIGVTINNPADPLFIGQQAIYQIEISNAGPAVATGVQLLDSITSGTIVGVTGGQATGPLGTGSATIDVADIPANSTVTIDVAVDPTTSTNALVNNASVTTTAYDPNPNNNTSSSSNVVSPVNLGVAVTTSTTPVLVGKELAYTLTISNAGPAAATNVLLSGTFPTNATFLSANTSQGTFTPSGSAFSATLGTVNPGGSVTITLLFTGTSVGSATISASVTSDDFNTSTSSSASGTATVFDQAGTINVAVPLVVVSESSGTATINLTRTNGSLGAITVNYATSDYTAVAGVNYVASTGTVTFAAGQLTQTITIPLIDAHIYGGVVGFFVTLSSPGGGATLGSSNETGILIVNNDVNPIPPAVSGLTAIPNANGVDLNGFTITFNEPMDPFRASILTNYHVFYSAADAGQPGGLVPVNLVAAIYNPVTNSVSLIPSTPLAGNNFYRIVANGSYGPVLTSTFGVSLSGNTGQGSNYDVYYGIGTSLRYLDGGGNVVTLNLSGGGTQVVVRDPQGNAASVTLVGIVPHKTSITGAVKKLSKTSTGFTTIDTFTGFGAFGNVFSNLTTPQFYVANNDVGTASALSISTKKTPKGPLALVQ